MDSYWIKSYEKKEDFEKLTNNINTSICIIGGGLTGLTCGYYLSKHIDNVIIIEKDKICSSTSGKNTGKVTSEHGLFYKYLTKSNGEEFAKLYLEANENAINNIEQIINTEQIECEFKRTDSYVFAMTNQYVQEIIDEEKSVNKLKKEKSKLEKATIPLETKEAIKFTNQAQINPVKYGHGLANCIIKNNGKIFENSKAIDIQKVGNQYKINVNNNNVIADKVIIATRYPTINIPGYYFLKMYQSTSYAVVADTNENIFDGYCINSDNPKISFRTIEENGKKLLLAVGYDYKTGTEQITNGYNNLEKIIKQMYPKSNILYKWSAEDCISLDKIPYIGEYSNLMKNIYIATGYNKWGLTTSNIAGNIITDKILGKKNKYENLYKSTRLEPIKNKDEVKNMLSEVKDSIILSKIKMPKQTIDDIKLGEGKIVKVNNQKVGVYKSETGEIYTVKPVCTHLGCELYFNNNDKIWECPCHGSKFSYDGKSIEVPGINDLKK